MPEFGSFALLLALALSGYCLLAGGIALRQLATGARTRVSPERLAETARRAGIGSFIAVTGAAAALLYAVFTNDFSVSYILHHSNRALPGPYKIRRVVVRSGRLTVTLGLAARRLRLRAARAPQGRCPADCVRLHHSGGRADLLSAAVELCRAPPSRWCRERSRRTDWDSIPCSNIRRWSFTRRCSISAMWASPCLLPLPWAR